MVRHVRCTPNLHTVRVPKKKICTSSVFTTKAHSIFLHILNVQEKVRSPILHILRKKNCSRRVCSLTNRYPHIFRVKKKGAHPQSDLHRQLLFIAVHGTDCRGVPSSCVSSVLTLEVEFAIRQILAMMASVENLAAWFI